MGHGNHSSAVMTSIDSFGVKICGCGVIHLCFGPSTINLTQETVFQVTELLNQVSRDLAARASDRLEASATQEDSPSLSEVASTEAENVIKGRFPLHPPTG